MSTKDRKEQIRMLENLSFGVNALPGCRLGLPRALFLFSLFFSPLLGAHAGGVVSASGMAGALTNCARSGCHTSANTGYNYSATINLPTVLPPNAEAEFWLFANKASGEDAISAGFNLAATTGVLSLGNLALFTTASVAISNLQSSTIELTHTASLLASSGNFSWPGLRWQAPATLGTLATVYFCVNVANGNTALTGDGPPACGTRSVVANTLPVAASFTVATSLNATVSFLLRGSDGDAAHANILSYSIVSSPTNGVLSAPQGSTVTYMPNVNYSGTDSFTYRVADGVSDSLEGTVRIAVDQEDKSESTLSDSALAALLLIGAFSHGGNFDALSLLLLLALLASSRLRSFKLRRAYFSRLRSRFFD